MLDGLVELAAEIAGVCRRAVLAGGEGLSRVAGEGVGDTTFGVDVGPEAAVARWAEERAREGPLSVLTEDTGWRHLGPEGALEGFDHGGPRVVVDPVDGSRNLMFDLRSAWAAIGMAPAGAGEPRLSELTLGVVQELGTSRAGRALRLIGRAGSAGRSCVQELFALNDEGLAERLCSEPLVVDGEARVDSGFFPFFRYHPAGRVDMAKLEVEFFERLSDAEGADLRNVYDDQYISNTGQLVLLAQGKYRMIADLRAALAARDGGPAVTSKPYDIAAAVVCARGAGAVLEDPRGTELDTPLDASSPVAFVGYANTPTRARLRPHLLAVLGGD